MLLLNLFDRHLQPKLFKHPNFETHGVHGTFTAARPERAVRDESRTEPLETTPEA
jgi:hypothetical protein